MVEYVKFQGGLYWKRPPLSRALYAPTAPASPPANRLGIDQRESQGNRAVLFIVTDVRYLWSSVAGWFMALRYPEESETLAVS